VLYTENLAYHHQLDSLIFFLIFAFSVHSH
jgi:hypothetical protein